MYIVIELIIQLERFPDATNGNIFELNFDLDDGMGDLGKLTCDSLLYHGYKHRIRVGLIN